MSQQLLTKTHLINWCDEQVAQGKELKIGWEGGNDSGWVYFVIDDEQIEYGYNTDEQSELIDMMHTHLEYGSWAGEFSANGEAIYDPTLKAFVGTDHFGGDESEDWDCNIKITIPKSIWFERVEYAIEGADSDAQFAFVISNGFLLPEHATESIRIANELTEAIAAEITKFENQPGDHDEFRDIWQDEQIARSEFIEEGDNLVYTIEDLTMGTTAVDEKEIILELVNNNEDDD
jgi:hypothetical protein